MKKVISKKTVVVKKARPAKEVEETLIEEHEIEVKPKEKVNEAKKEEKKGVLEPLQPGQKYFEAPDGTVIIGEADKQQVWYRAGNEGKGCYINPKRD